ncbi:hypothetical protein [Streptomyces sp. DE06-01C]|nr:hypothetical protein [Streptomyces sp. DE06-01C]MDX5522186.1 hypothetical protein [Streptomyces sp. DE06-01C]
MERFERVPAFSVAAPFATVAAMETSAYPTPDVLVARLARSAGIAVPPGHPPSAEFLRDLAGRVGLDGNDLLVVAGLPLPEGALDLEGTAGGWVSSLVQHTLPLSAADRQRLRARARTLAAQPRPARTLVRPPQDAGPPGFGSLLVRLLALRNLNASAVAKTMCLMSGVCKAASTIRMVRDGAKDLDAELLDGFAAVLGVPVAVLASLTGVRPSARSGGPSPEVADVAALIREVRHLTEHQVRELADAAEALDRG